MNRQISWLIIEKEKTKGTDLVQNICHWFDFKIT